MSLLMKTPLQIKIEGKLVTCDCEISENVNLDINLDAMLNVSVNVTFNGRPNVNHDLTRNEFTK